MDIEFKQEYEDVIFPVSATYYPGRPASGFNPPDPEEVEFECEDLERVVRRVWSYYDFVEFVPSPRWRNYAEMVEAEAEDLCEAIIDRARKIYRETRESYEADRAEALMEERRLRCD